MADKPEIYGAEDEAELLRLARKRYDDSWEADRENREMAEDDLRFKIGEQWPDDVLNERGNRPTLTINRMPQFIRQVTGDIRLNRPSIKVRPVDDGADVDVAEIYSGVIRHIEQASAARVAYNTAADNAAACGMGAFRIITEYADNDVFDQDIRIKRIPNAFAVHYDPSATEIDRSDARYCFYVDMMQKEEFESRYPEAATTGFESSEEDNTEGWFKDEQIRVAEYWIKVPTDVEIGLDEDGRVFNVKDEPETTPIRTRVSKRDKIYQYIISGTEILEGPHEWPGKYLPFVPVMGEETHVGDRCIRAGVIRYAKDPQRMHNYWQSALVEHIALQPKAPFIGTTTQFKGLESKWASANHSNLPYLAYNVDRDAPGAPQRQMPPQMSSGLVDAKLSSAEDMKAVTGIYDAALGQRSNETSGKAIMARQQEGDVGTYVYIDNLSHALNYAGKILVDLIPKIYDGERVIRVLGEDDTEDFAKLNVPVLDEDGEIVYKIQLTDKQGRTIYKPTLDAGKYDVVVQTGPSYSTKRQEAADSMIQFAQAVPGAAGLIGDLIAKNMDWPLSDQIAERLKKTLPPGLDEDAPPAPPPQPDPKMVADAAEAEAKVKKLTAETAGQELENAAKQYELAQAIGAIPQMVQEAVQSAIMQALSGGGGIPPEQPMQGPQRPPQGGFFMPDGEGGQGF